MSGDLFTSAATDRLARRAPLADRLRPTRLDDVVGQEHRLRPYRNDPNSPLYALLARVLTLRYWVVLDRVSSAHQRGYRVSPHAVVLTVRGALRADSSQSMEDEASHPERSRGRGFVVNYPNFLAEEG